MLLGVPRTFATSQFGPRCAARRRGSDFEAPGREDHRPRAQLGPRAVRRPRHHARDAAVRVAQQVLDRRLVTQLDPRARCRRAVPVHEPGPAVHGADGQATPEPVAPVGLVALALVHEPEAHAVPGEPADDVARVADERAGHRGVAAAERHASHVAEEVLLGVRLQIGVRQRLLGEQLADVLEAAVGDADRPRGERRVPARPRGVGLLEHEHAGPALAGCVRRAQAGVAGAGDDDVGVAHGTR